MRPAFTSTRQALAFAALLATIIALPALAACTGWFKIDGRYPRILETFGPFPLIEQRVFGDTNRVDVAFVGSSHMFFGVDARYVQEQFSQHLHHEAEVFTLGWQFAGYDILYFVTHDLLVHRPVKMLVVYDEIQRVPKSPGSQEFVYRTYSLPDRRAFNWFCRGEDTAALRLLQIPLKPFIFWYGTAIIDFPRHLVDMIRPSEGFNLDQRPDYQKVIDGRGSLAQDLGWGDDLPAWPWILPGSDVRHVLDLRKKKSTLKSYNASEFPATSADTVIYTAATRDRFTFTGPPLDAYELYFARQLARLCQEHGTRLVMLHIPTSTESQSATILETQCWPEVLQSPIELVGIPDGTLFANRPVADVRRLFYYNELHLNRNGQELFTRVITPALIQLSDGQTGSVAAR